MKWLVTGDMHGAMGKITHIKNYIYKNKSENEIFEDYSIIILGDAGFNFYLDLKDAILKNRANKYGFKIYCVRGNHEARPSDIENMQLIFDENVNGNVYFEKDYPNIRYFIDGDVYNINQCKTLVIGGAYSVDKYYRLANEWPWFENELLTENEMNSIFEKYQGESFDLILTHTCPLSWEPIDLFLDFIDQTSVDTSMEVWMDEFKEQISYNVWLFGHFHDDRLVRPGVEMFYTDIQPLNDILSRWEGSNPIIPPYWEFDPKYNEGR